MFKVLCILMMSLYGTFLYGKSIKIHGEQVILEEKVSAQEVLHLYAKETGKNLILSKAFSNYEITVLGKKEFPKTKLKKFLYEILKKSNLSLLRGKSSLEVIQSRDVRYAGTRNTYSIDEVPNTLEYVRFIHKLNFAEASNLSRNFRPFLSRYGRVVDLKNSNTLVIADTGKNIRKIFEIIKVLDTPDYLKSKAQIKEINNARKEKVSFSWSDFLEKKNGLFLVLFSLVGIIFGYGVRSIIKSREESSWS